MNKSISRQIETVFIWSTFLSILHCLLCPLFLCQILHIICYCYIYMQTLFAQFHDFVLIENFLTSVESIHAESHMILNKGELWRYERFCYFDNNAYAHTTVKLVFICGLWYWKWTSIVELISFLRWSNDTCEDIFFNSNTKLVQVGYIIETIVRN